MQQASKGDATGAVYVQTNASPNEVIAFRRMTDGSLERIGVNDRVCAVEGEVRPRTDGVGFDVVFEVSEMVWERVA